MTIKALLKRLNGVETQELLLAMIEADNLRADDLRNTGAGKGPLNSLAHWTELPSCIAALEARAAIESAKNYAEKINPL